MRAVDPAETHVIVHEELPRRRAVLGPGAYELALVVAVGVLGLDVEDRPVGDVGEEQFDVVVEFLGTLERPDGDIAVLVALAFHVPELDRIAAAERDEGPAVQHPAAEVEVLVDDEHRRAEIACPDRRGQAGAAAARDDDVGFVVPLDLPGARRCLLRPGGACLDHCGRAESGRGGRLDEVAPAYAALVPMP